MKAVSYWLIFLVAALWFAGFAVGGAWPLLVPVVVFGLIPALDPLFGRDDAEPVEGAVGSDLPLLLWVPMQLVALGLMLASVHTRTPLELVAGTVSLGLLSGAGGITIAHELMHRKGRTERVLAEVLMTSVSYTWFCVEHVLGHHRNVATAEDPATSRFGESVYAFVPRSVIGGLRSAWRLEGERASRRGIGTFDLRNRRLRYPLVLAAVHAAVLALAGPVGWAVFVLQGVVAVLLLEAINYVEHYGLQRARKADGSFERVRPEHSWNSTHQLTGAFLFNLPRHADHHAYASRPFWQLRAWPGAPEMPFGYATMVLVAVVPPLWFAWMNPRVAALRAQG